MVPPLVYLHLTMQTSRRYNAFAVSGEPVLPYCNFRQAAPGCIQTNILSASHHPAVLLENGFAY